jgi:3-oxoacyl-[acyl-carrier-protein] synthase-3
VAHQANERILDHASERMGIDPAKVVMNLDRLGNTSSASIPLALADAVDTGMLEEGALVLMVGFGAGLTWGSVLVRWEPRA